MEAKKDSRKVLMLPWLAYGHILPYLELAKRLSLHNFHIYLCSSPVNLHGIRTAIPEKFSASIELIELHLPSLPELPPHLHTTNGLSPHLLPTLFEALDMAAPHFSTILHQLNPDLLVSDFFQPWAIELASSLRIPATSLIATGAASLSCIVHCLSTNSANEFPFPEIRSLERWISIVKDLPNNSKGGFPRFFQWMKNQESLCPDILLVNTFEDMEGKYMDYLSVLLKKKIVPVGPLVQEAESRDDESSSNTALDWLDKKHPKSTVFVSFGSEYYLSKEEREELALGLELSGANFIWVVRFPKGAEKVSMEEALPEGFLERVGERGMVIDGWAPQMKILAHSSVGGFVSHCGWNSVVEAVAIGVPIVALPMHLDHPCHARVAAAAGVCVEVDKNNEPNIEREGVAKAIREVVFGKKGEDLRRKVREISKGLKPKQDQSIERLVAEFDRLCEARKLKLG